MSAALNQITETQTTGRSAGLDAAAGDDAMDILPRASRVHARKLVSDAPAVADRSSLGKTNHETRAALAGATAAGGTPPHQAPAAVLHQANEARRAKALDRQARFVAAIRSGATITTAAAAVGVTPSAGTRYALALTEADRALLAKATRDTRSQAGEEMRAQRAAAAREYQAKVAPRIAEMVSAGQTYTQVAAEIGHSISFVGRVARSMGVVSPFGLAAKYPAEPPPREKVVKVAREKAAPAPIKLAKVLKPATPAPKRVRAPLSAAAREQVSKPALPKKRIPLNCMTCSNPFLSWDRAKNRMCRFCRSEA